jgi:hypothetical protein
MGVLNDVFEITGWTSVGSDSHYINTCVGNTSKGIPSFIFYFKDTTQRHLVRVISCISMMPKPTRLHQSMLVSVVKFRKS